MREQKQEKAKDFTGTLKRLIKSLKKYYVKLIIIIVFAILSTLFTIVGPKVLGNATTIVFEGIVSKINGIGSINFDKLYNLLLVVLFLYIISALFSYISGMIISKISQKYAEDLRKKVNRKIEKLPFSYFDKHEIGDTLSLITNDIDTITMNLQRSVTEVITSITSVIGILIMMLSINFSMTIVTLVVLPISLLLSATLIKKSQKYFKERQEKLARVNTIVEETLTNHTIVKAFSSEDKTINALDKENKDLYTSTYKSIFYSSLMQPIMLFIGNLGYVVVAILGAFNVIKGRISVGSIQSFITYTKNFTNPIANLGAIFTEFQSAIAASERVFIFLDEKEETADGTLSLTNPIGNIEFKHVKFGYNEKIVINDFNAKIKPGEKIAIVGPTGAGKTTIVKLLMRFYDTISGEILIDGKNIKDIKRRDLRRSFGMVLQDTWLFNDTIMENLRYGRVDATDEEVIEAAKTAHVDHFIKTLTSSYNMVLSEDVSNISEGQKQLLTIARAILSNPKFLILDEATSSVDTRTEKLIVKAMDALMKNRTSFIIAHRLSTIVDADLILVMNNGDIIEQGTHEELISKNGFYANLYNSQFDE